MDLSSKYLPFVTSAYVISALFLIGLTIWALWRYRQAKQALLKMEER